ncbi:MAG: VWA domain-containing protein [Gammaproteobacteria bacterium]
MEDKVGELWHKFISRLADKRYPRAAVALPDVQHGLGIFYRALGGDGGLQLQAVDASENTSKRNWLQKLAGTNTQLHLAWQDDRALRLPPTLAWFDNVKLNRELYFWLTALAASAARFNTRENNSDWFNTNQRLTQHVLENYPGLVARYQRLVQQHLLQRPALDTLASPQLETETAIRQALLEPGSVTALPENTRGMQAVPLWLHPGPPLQGTRASRDDAQTGTQHSKDMRELDDVGQRNAEEVDEPEADRGLITVRMENIFSMGEFVNVDRGTEEEDDIDRAEDVARDLEKLAISRNAKASTATLKFDLDLPSASEDDTIINDGIMLPEWNWKTSRLKPDHCRIVEMRADSAEPCALPAHLTRTARKLRSQFQALAPAKHWHNAQTDGQEIDIDACIRFACDRHSGHSMADGNYYRELRSGERDLSCLLLADLSLSTDAYIDNHQRIIDVIRDSLFLFGECLHSNGDRFALCGFSSRKRDPVRLHTIKNFEEAYDSKIRGRIAAIKPGYYTRLGAGIRYATQQLIAHGSGRRLLLVLTDGKPNDLDQYEGRYGIEDTRHAVIAARRSGLLPFCVTIDHRGNDYLPHIFGKGSYVVIHKPARLPQELPRLYALFSQQAG